MTQVNSTNEQNSYVKPSAGAVAGGVVVGSMANGAVKNVHKAISPKLLDQMTKISAGLTEDQFASVKTSVENTLTNTGLEKKGVQVIKANADNADEIIKIMTKEYDGSLITRFMPKSIKELLATTQGSMVSEGKNAFYAAQSKKVVLPEKGLALSAFHELGHAANANLSKFGKVLQKSRGLTALALPIFLIAMFKTKKQEGQQPTGKVDKATTFVKDNAGKLTFAAFLPMLLEEGLASVKGNGYAKELLSKDLAGKVAKTNALGFATYLGLAALSSLGVYLGVKIKDKIVSNKQEKMADAPVKQS